MTDRRSLVRGSLLAALAALSGSAAADAPQVPEASLAGLQWRLVGPHRAGWGTVAAGIADQPNRYYFGAAGGGVWASDDAGRTWQPRSEGLAMSSVGALAVAPSKSDVLYVGMGQVEARWDVANGDGVYRSDDGGRHWRSLGLAQTHRIGAIVVHPTNPDHVLVAALGRFFAPSRERGVYRSTDGGANWTQTLAIDDVTGVVDLAADPVDPDLVYAAAWESRNRPWMTYYQPEAGPGSGLYRSKDGGANWKRLQGAGLPGGSLGRIGLAATRTAQGARVYAVIDSDEVGGLYRSDDGGDTWQVVNADRGLGGGSYFSRLTVHPTNPDVLWVMGRSLKRSDDGGRTFDIVKGSPGGDDYHHLWVNPKHPSHMITATDQGTVVTQNGGETWSSWYNQPTGQFYHLATDNRFPYWIYAGQQDNGTARIASRSDYGQITFRDWHPTGADERDQELPDPDDPNIVYGSGLGGRLSRWDARNGEVQNITPWPISSYGQRPSDYRHHYTWITPIAFSPVPPHALYFGSQVLFRSEDRGRRWQAISPDLNAGRKGRKDCGGEPDPVRARDCGYGTIFEIEPSPHSVDEVWIGTDDGLVQLTRDGGKTWRNVTPPTLPAWALVSRIDLSRRKAGTAYVAVDNHRQDDFSPRAYRTGDYGRTWTAIGEGLPAGRIVSVVRADPVREGLLYAGTDVGVQVSFDDGAHWQSLQRNLPSAWVRDLLVKDDDLIVATQGRAIWVLDDVGPLRQIDAGAAPLTRLFKPTDAYRLRHNQNKDTPLPPDEPTGRNPPTGAIIDYVLATDAAAPVLIEIHAADGTLVRRYASNDPPSKLTVERYFAKSWVAPEPRPGTSAGAHRFVWDLRHARPRASQYEYSIAAVQGVDTTVQPAGPLVAPGTYRVSLVVGGERHSESFTVKPDPRVVLPAGELELSIAYSLELAGVLERQAIARGEISGVRERLATLVRPATGDPVPAALSKAAAALDAKLAPLVSGDGDRNLNLNSIGEVLVGVAIDVEGTDRAPTPGQRAVVDDCRARMRRALDNWQYARQKDLPALDAALVAAKRDPVHVPTPEEIYARAAAESKDRP